jgi:nucleotide-binding universal stress UspA family protein
LALAKAVDAKVTALTVTEPWPSTLLGVLDLGLPVEEYERSAADYANRVLSKVYEAAVKSDVTLEVVHVPDQSVAEAIIGTAIARECDLIVLGSHGWRALPRLLLGSQAYNVVTQSNIPVLIVR